MAPDEPNPSRAAPDDISALINAFRYFNETATTLTQSYHALEARVAELTKELDAKDKQLYSRMRELDRVSRYLSSLLESMSSGVVGVDLEGRVTIFNRTAAQLTGMVAEEAIGRPYEEVIGGEGIKNGALFTLQNGPELRGVERDLPAGGMRISLSTLWVVDSYGERVGVVELFDDVTQLRRLEEKFQHQKTLAALGEMASMLAHELRNPLHGISGYALLLKEQFSGIAEAEQLLSRIIANVKALDRLAANLLFLARPADLEAHPQDLQQLISELTALLESEARQQHYPPKINLKLPAESIPIVMDRDVIHTALLNIGRNGLQSMPDGGELTISVKWQLLMNKVLIDIEDTGCGIDEKTMTKLFNPFFSTKDTGTGLGLALVKKAIDLHKGTIDVNSRLGEGTRFTLTLPINNFTQSAEIGG